MGERRGEGKGGRKKRREGVDEREEREADR